MQKKFNAYRKYKLYNKLITEYFDGILSQTFTDVVDKDVLTKCPIEDPADVLATVDKDEDIPGVIAVKDPKLIAVYNKVISNYEPSQLIYDNKENQ